MNRKVVINIVSPLLDVILAIAVIPAAIVLKFARRLGLQRLRLCRTILIQIGVLPLRRHYYEPFITSKDLRQPLDTERKLPGIEWAVTGQLAFLSTLTYESELAPGRFSPPVAGKIAFDFENDSFKSGDAEYLYQLLRRVKPARVIEIGSGQSTLIARAAIEKNRQETANLVCEHVCIEPYESPWLDELGVTILRQRVQDVNRSIFSELSIGDLLFIDSSHVLRPQGDVVTEYLEILPSLKSGVIVHIHDVFSPRDYPAHWVLEKLMLWNEQYMLEAFLTNNREWKIIGALNFLKHTHYDALKRACPYLKPEREPGSFYIRKQ